MHRIRLAAPRVQRIQDSEITHATRSLVAHRQSRPHALHTSMSTTLSCHSNSSMYPPWIADLLSALPDVEFDPLPHLPSPEPFQDYCLTPHLPTDIDYLPEIINHPLSGTSGFRQNEGVMTTEFAKEWIETSLSENEGHFPLSGESRFCPPLIWPNSAGSTLFLTPARDTSPIVSSYRSNTDRSWTENKRQPRRI